MKTKREKQLGAMKRLEGQLVTGTKGMGRTGPIPLTADDRSRVSRELDVLTLKIASTV